MLRFLLSSSISLYFILFTYVTLAQSSENYENALSEFNKGDVDSSYIFLRNALDETPAHLPSKILMGRILLLKGRILDSVIELNEADEFGADKNLTMPILAEAYFYSEQFEKLIAINSSGLNKNNAFEISLLKGSAYYNLNDIDLAFSEYSYGVSLFPKNTRALNSLASVYLQRREFENAEKLITQSLALDTENPRTIQLRGLFEKLKGNSELALQYFEKAYKLSPNNPIIRRSLASAYASIQDPRAAQIVEEIIEQTPNDPFAILLKGRLLSQNNDFEAANKTYEQLLQRLTSVPEDVKIENSELHFVSGLAAYLSANYELALANFERYLASHSPNINTLSLMTDTYVKLNQKRKAQLLLENNYSIVKRDEYLSLALCDFFIQNKKVFKCTSLLDQSNLALNQSNKAKLVRIRTLEATGNIKQALDLFKQTFSPPYSEPYRFSLVTLLQQNQLNNEALELTNFVLQEEPKNITYQLVKAQILYQQNKFSDSLDIALQANQSTPNNRNILAAIARAHLALSEYEKSELVAKTMTKKNPTDIEGGLLLGQSLFFQNKLEQALVVLIDIKAIATNNPYPSELIARIYVKQNKLENARKELELLTRTYLLVPEYHLALADVYFKEGKDKKVKRELSIVFRVWLDDVVKLVGLSRQQTRMHDFEGAYSSLRRANIIRPDSLAITLPLIQAMLRIDKVSEAEELANTLLSKHSNNSMVNTRVGEVLKAQGKTNEAQPYFLKALTLDNSNTTAGAYLYQLAIMGIKSNSFDKLAVSIVEQSTSNLFVRRLLADFLLVNNESERALEHYLYLENQDGVKNKPSIYNNLANIYSNEDTNLALEYATKAVEGENTVADFVDTKGWILAQQSKFGEALPFLRQAYALDSSAPGIRYHLAFALYNLDRKAEAAIELRKALESERKFTDRQAAQSLLDKI